MSTKPIQDSYDVCDSSEQLKPADADLLKGGATHLPQANIHHLSSPSNPIVNLAVPTVEKNQSNSLEANQHVAPSSGQMPEALCGDSESSSVVSKGPHPHPKQDRHTTNTNNRMHWQKIQPKSSNKASRGMFGGRPPVQQQPKMTQPALKSSQGKLPLKAHE